MQHDREWKIKDAVRDIKLTIVEELKAHPSKPVLTDLKDPLVAEYIAIGMAADLVSWLVEGHYQYALEQIDVLKRRMRVAKPQVMELLESHNTEMKS